MENLWHLISSLLSIINTVASPVLIFFWWLFRKYDRRLEIVEERITRIELEAAVLETKLDHVTAGIDEIKSQLQRLFDILTSNKR